MPMDRWQVLSIHSFSIEMSGYHFFQISEYLDTHNVWILGYKCIFGGSKRKRSCFGKSPYVLFRKAPNVQLSELKLCDCDFPASISNNSLKSCKHIFSKVKSELPDHVEKNQVVKQKTKKVKLKEDCQLCLNQNEDDGRLGTDLLISMTSLLTHTVAHSTRPSFRPKINNHPLKKFLILAVS